MGWKCQPEKPETQEPEKIISFHGRFSSREWLGFSLLVSFQRHRPYDGTVDDKNLIARMNWVRHRRSGDDVLARRIDRNEGRSDRGIDSDDVGVRHSHPASVRRAV